MSDNDHSVRAVRSGAFNDALLGVTPVHSVTHVIVDGEIYWEDDLSIYEGASVAPIHVSSHNPHPTQTFLEPEHYPAVKRHFI